MKTNKALKRLAKIEASMLDVTERYSASAPHVRQLLQDAKAAVTLAKEAVSLQASSGTAKNPPVKHSKPTSKSTPGPSKPKRKPSAAGRKAIISAAKERSALKRAEAESGPPKKKAPKNVATKNVAVKASAKATKKAVKKTAAKIPQKAAKAPGQTVVEVAAQ